MVIMTDGKLYEDRKRKQTLENRSNIIKYQIFLLFIKKVILCVCFSPKLNEEI